jgi:putative Mg2+ transporter-C (MgtC) family protein
MDIITNTVGVVAAKLILAVIFGALLGLERSLARKTAGMRTYTLVSMGAALFVIIAEMVGQHYMELGIRTFDPLRVASQVIVGIGFLGAGLIIFQDNKLRGLTTAAGLWVAAGLGMAVGYGLYLVAAMVTILTLFIFTILWYVERLIEKHAPAPNQRKNQ